MCEWIYRWKTGVYAWGRARDKEAIGIEQSIFMEEEMKERESAENILCGLAIGLIMITFQ